MSSSTRTSKAASGHGYPGLDGAIGTRRRRGPTATYEAVITARDGGPPARREGIIGRCSKIVVEVVLTFVALLLTAPAILLLALIVRIESSGPALYRQVRVGKHGRQFICFKLRTMFVDADRRLQQILDDDEQARQEFASSRKLKADPRITRTGHFLRATSLDELPQLWNVLRGDMSLVGPRPLVPDELGKYGDQIDTVLQVKPGITGIWQVSGRNNLPYDVRVALDSYYATNRTLRGDLAIVLRTIPALLYRRGAY